MHSINLSYRGIGGDDGAVEFIPQGQTLAVAEVNNAAAVKLAVRIAMFGAGTADAITDGAEVRMDFSFRGKKYLLTRAFHMDNGHTEETVALTQTDDGNTVHFDNVNLEKLLEDAFGSSDFFRLSDISEVTAERAALALKLSDEALVQAAKAKTELKEKLSDCTVEIEKLSEDILSLGHENPEAIEEKQQILTILQKEADKQAKIKAAHATAERLETFRSRLDIKDKQDVLQRDQFARQAVESNRLIGIKKQMLFDKKQQQTETEKNAEGLTKKVMGGSRAEKDLEAEFLYKNERLKGLQNKFVDTVTLAEKENSELRRTLQSYFQKSDAQITELTAKKKRLDHEYEALLLSITGLEDKKKRLTHPMSFKKALIDGTVYEHRIEQLTAEIEDGNRRSGELQLEIAAKNEDIRALTVEIGRLQVVKTKLFQQITEGKYETKEEALNADEVYKFKLYNAHAMVESLAAEIAALNEKVSALTKRNIENDKKSQQLEFAKEELEIHLVKLHSKLKGLEQQYTAKLAENLFSDAAAKLQYGQRCPVCDGYVIKRNPAPCANLEAITKEINALKAEIAAADAKLQNILLKVGAYLSTTASGNAYLAALNNTVTKKAALSKHLLSEGGATTRDELKKAVQAAAERSRTKHALSIQLMETDAKLIAAAQNKTLIETSIQTLSGRESARIKRNVERAQVALESILQNYRKLMPVFGGKSAKELLSGSLVDEIELETVEVDLVSHTKGFREITVQKIETDRMLILLKNRLVTSVTDDGESFEDVLLKVLSHTARDLAAEMQTAEAELEDVKIRLAAVRRVTQRAGAENDSRQISAKEYSVEIENAEQQIADLEARLAKLLKTLGVSTAKEAEKLILSDGKRKEYEHEIAEYAKELERLQEELHIAESQPVTLEFVNVDALNARLKELDAALAEIEQQKAVKTDALNAQAARQTELQAALNELTTDDKIQFSSVTDLFSALIAEANETLAKNNVKLKMVAPKTIEQPVMFAHGKQTVGIQQLTEAETVAVSLAYFAVHSAMQAKLHGEYALPVVALTKNADKTIKEVIQNASITMPMLIAAEGNAAKMFL